ncbi:hypothetical protein LCGC14_1232110 [marine sediment metagenome]|uniref:Uncharacterized protein n=1 Tax=marine sediment metagenome TaxID=412755 RepID=A0A0F9LCC4_9ZZZZ
MADVYSDTDTLIADFMDRRRPKIHGLAYDPQFLGNEHLSRAEYEAALRATIAERERVDNFMLERQAARQETIRGGITPRAVAPQKVPERVPVIARNPVVERNPVRKG